MCTESLPHFVIVFFNAISWVLCWVLPYIHQHEKLSWLAWCFALHASGKIWKVLGHKRRADSKFSSKFGDLFHGFWGLWDMMSWEVEDEAVECLGDRYVHMETIAEGNYGQVAKMKDKATCLTCPIKWGIRRRISAKPGSTSFAMYTYTYIFLLRRFTHRYFVLDYITGWTLDSRHEVTLQTLHTSIACDRLCIFLGWGHW